MSLRNHDYVLVKLPDHHGNGTPADPDRGTSEGAIGAVGGEGERECEEERGGEGDGTG